MNLNVKAGLLSLLAVFVCSTTGGAQAKDVQKPAVKKVSEPWWKHAVFYEIYPRSFADSDNNGMGDIKGITQKLDYLHDLGVDALWITPCYPSPQVDFGYDISDYCDIAPEYGTLADFDELVKEAKKRNIHIVMDLVMNHCSDKHKWFEESRSSRTNPKRNWFIWRDPKSGPLPKNSSGAPDPKSPPNNWLALFGHSAWQWDPKTNQYYYHFFYPEQPDLNWRNGQVKKAMNDVARFWLDRGVAGFRLDAINTLYEDAGLHDNPVKPGKNAYGDPNMDDKFNYLLLPEIKDTMRDLRKVLDSYPDNPVLLGETTAEKIDQLVAAYGKNNDEIQLPMDFRFAYINKLSAPEFRSKIAEIDDNEVGGQPTYVFSNHDIVRHYIRYGDGKNNDQIAKLTATLLLTTRGTPVMYYGEELGMENRDPESKEEVQDPIGIIGWPKQKGRDGERTPMQWDATKNAGFSTAKPWLPVTSSFKTHNVEVEKRDPDSILNFYKQLLSLRRKNVAIKYGRYVALNEKDEHVVTYLRKKGGAAALVACNMSPEPRKVSLNLQPNGITNLEGKVLLASYSAPDSISTNSFTLPPFAVLIADVSRTTQAPKSAN
jgi:alpha-glucosidase